MAAAFAVVALLVTGVLSICLRTSAAETEPVIGELNSAEHFVISDDGDLTALSDAGKAIADGCTELHVIIPDGVTSINKSAGYYTYSPFDDYGSKLNSVVFPDSLTSLGKAAFYRCTGLTSVDFTACTNLTSIAYDVFGYCKNLTNIDLSACMNLTSIGSDSFYQCTSLTSIDLSSTQLTKLEHGLFNACSGLTSVTLPDSLTSIDNGAFYMCKSLTNINLSACTNLTMIGEHTFYMCSSLTSVDLSACTNLTKIYRDTFYKCSSLTNIILPDSLTSIDSGAFYMCSSLTNVTLPNGITNINFYSNPFSECSNLTDVHYQGTIDQWVEKGINIFQDGLTMTFNDGKTLSNDTETIKLTTATKIGEYVFSELKKLTTVELPDGLTMIDYEAFKNCSGLTSIIFPNSLTDFGYRAFKGCSGLTSIDLSNTQLTSIEDSAFEDCSSLTSVALPKDITNIASGAFSGCSALKSIVIPANLKSGSGLDDNDAVVICDDLMTMLNYYRTWARYNDEDGDYYMPESIQRLTFPVGVQINLTDQNSQAGVFAEKTLFNLDGNSDWYWENGAWVQNADHVMAALPTLPTNWVWQDAQGNVLDAARLQALFQQGKDAHKVVTVDATAVDTTVQVPVSDAPTADTTHFVYDGTAKTYLPQGFDDATMTIENNTRTDAGSQTVTVRLKDPTAVFAGVNQNFVTFTFTINNAKIGVAQSVETVDVAGLDGDYQIKLPDCIQTFGNCAPEITYLRTNMAGADDSFAGLMVFNAQTAPGKYYVYYQVTAANHDVYMGMYEVIVENSSSADVGNDEPADNGDDTNVAGIILGVTGSVAGVASAATGTVMFVLKRRRVK